MRVWPFSSSKRSEADFRLALEEARMAGYTDAVYERILATAQGEGEKDVAQTSAAEFGVRYMGAALAMATVDPPLPVITPSVLFGIGRSLMCTGESAWLIEVDDELRLTEATVKKVRGGHRTDTWRLALEIDTPNGLMTEEVPALSAVHVRINPAVGRPWTGQSPLALAGYSGSMLANIDTRLRDEANTPVGSFLSLPDGVSSDVVQGVASDYRKSKGGLVTIERSAGGWHANPNGVGTANLVRFGPNIPATSLQAHKEAATEVLGVMGIPGILMHGGGGSEMREAYRQFLTMGVQPLGAVVQQELSHKLDMPIGLNFSRLAAADTANRARAMASMVAAGMPMDQAQELADLMP